MAQYVQCNAYIVTLYIYITCIYINISYISYIYITNANAPCTYNHIFSIKGQLTNSDDINRESTARNIVHKTSDGELSKSIRCYPHSDYVIMVLYVVCDVLVTATS